MPIDSLFTHSNFENASLLVIEDHPDVWLLTQHMLSRGLPEVTIKWVATGSQALDYLKDCLVRGEGLPKLILQDLYLPNREDGLKLIRSIRSLLTAHAGPQLPIVVYSSSTHPDDVQQCYRDGASAYVVKATDIDRQVHNFSALRQFWFETSVLPISTHRLPTPPHNSSYET